ncbi:MAG: electron transfer flavoprotein subunit beta/FixA family protein [Candidatus Muiribacteriota bacterium]
MRIIVTVKQVPKTNDVKWDRTRGTLKREGVESVINPEDKYALETALYLKEKHGAQVTVLTMGPPQAEHALREVLAMGADKAALVTDRAFAGADTLATSYILSEAVKKIGDYDYIFCGRQAIDGDTAQVGPQLAGFLDIPQVTYVSEFNFEQGGMKIKKETDSGYQYIKVNPPILLTFISSEEPRYPSVRGIFESFDKEIEHITNAELGIAEENVGLDGSPTKVKKVFKPAPKGKGRIISDGSPREMASKISDFIKEKNVFR